MSGKKYTPEQIMGKLQDELLNREIFSSLRADPLFSAQEVWVINPVSKKCPTINYISPTILNFAIVSTPNFIVNLN